MHTWWHGLILLVVGAAFADAVGSVPAQPAVHRLARYPVPERDLGHGQAAEHLQHCLVALAHDSQLDQHVPALPRFADPSGRLFEVGLAPASGPAV
jgi:hypothetical protein